MPKRKSAAIAIDSTLPPPRPARGALDLARVRLLAEVFYTECGALGGRKLHSHFEQWLWSARAGSTEESVPVIPSPCAPEASVALCRKLVCAGMSENAALLATKALEQKAATLARRTTCAHILNEERSDEVRISPTTSDNIVTLTCSGQSVQCTLSHLQKLRTLLRSPETSDESVRERQFERHAYCVLARILALQGGEPRAGGMQAAVGYRVFDVLAKHYGVTFELFASPLNARFSSYCSASPDVDCAFGSVGSFFSQSLDIHLASGAFEANPPYDPPLIAAMTERMLTLLTTADTQQNALTFIIIIPHWPDKPCWQALEQSTYCSLHLRLPQAEHGFFEGGQHYRPQLWRRANHDTSVFFLQSNVAPRPSKTSLEALRRAFRSAQSSVEAPLLGAHESMRPPRMTDFDFDANAVAEQPNAKRSAVGVVASSQSSSDMAEPLAGKSGKQRKLARKRLRERKRKAMAMQGTASSALLD